MVVAGHHDTKQIPTTGKGSFLFLFWFILTKYLPSTGKDIFYNIYYFIFLVNYGSEVI